MYYAFMDRSSLFCVESATASRKTTGIAYNSSLATLIQVKYKKYFGFSVGKYSFQADIILGLIFT